MPFEVQLGSGTFQVSIDIGWYGNGRFLGDTSWRYTHATDYECLISCTRGGGWVQI
jgi:hypothetical protein